MGSRTRHVRTALTSADLQRALLARVADRVRAAGHSVEPDELEHIVRQVLSRLGPGTGSDTRRPSAGSGMATDENRMIMVCVFETEHGDPGLDRLQREVEAAARHADVRLLASHRAPVPTAPDRS